MNTELTNEIVEELKDEVTTNIAEESLSEAAEVIEKTGIDLKTVGIVGGVITVIVGVGAGAYLLHKKHKNEEAEEGSEKKRRFTLLPGRHKKDIEDDFEDDFTDEYFDGFIEDDDETEE